MTTPSTTPAATTGLFAPERVRERVVVKPGDCIAAFSIVGGVIIERELVDEAGHPCNSVGQPLPVGKAGKTGGVREFVPAPAGGKVGA